MQAEEFPDIGELYRSEHQTLVGRLVNQCGDPELAEELAQDAFLAARRYIHTFDASKGSPRTWLFAIAQNALRKRMQREAKREATPLREDPADERAPTESSFERRWTDETVRAAVQALPEPQRSVIRLKYFANATLEACAREIGLSKGTAARRLSEGLRLLKAELQRRGVQGGADD